MAFFAPFYHRTFPNASSWKNLFLGCLVTLFHITSFSCIKYKPSFNFDDPSFIYDISFMTLTMLFLYLFDFSLFKQNIKLPKSEDDILHLQQLDRY